MIIYSVKFRRFSDKKEFLLYSPISAAAVKTQAIANAKLTIEVNEASSFSFDIAQSHPYYDEINALAGCVLVYQSVNNQPQECLFRGRIESVDVSSILTKSVKCSGGLGWLKHSYFSHYFNRYARNYGAADETKRLNSRMPSKFPKDAEVAFIIQSVLNTHNWQLHENTTENMARMSDPDNGDMDIAFCSARQNPYGLDVRNTSDTQSSGVFIERRTDDLKTTYDWFQDEIVDKCHANIVVDEGTNLLYVFGENPPMDTSGTVLKEGECVVSIATKFDWSNLFTVFMPIGKSKSTTVGKDDSASATSVTYYTNIVDDLESFVVYGSAKAYVPKDEAASIVLDEDAADMNETTFNRVYGSYVNTITANDPNGVKVLSDDMFPGGVTFTLDPPFIVWKEGVEKYGRIIGHKQWGNASRTQLRAYAPAYFREQILDSVTVDAIIIDPALYDNTRKWSLHVGMQYWIDAPMRGVKGYFVLKKAEIDLLNAKSSKYSFGRTRKSLSGVVNQITRANKIVNNGAAVSEKSEKIITTDKATALLSEKWTYERAVERYGPDDVKLIIDDSGEVTWTLSENPTIEDEFAAKRRADVVMFAKSVYDKEHIKFWDTELYQILEGVIFHSDIESILRRHYGKNLRVVGNGVMGVSPYSEYWIYDEELQEHIRVATKSGGSIIWNIGES